MTTGGGVEVTGFSTHFIDRVIGQVGDAHRGSYNGINNWSRQGVSIDEVKSTLQSDKYVVSQRETIKDGSRLLDERHSYQGENIQVTVSKTDGTLIQTNKATNTSKIKR